MSGQRQTILVNNPNQILRNGNKIKHTYQALQHQIKRTS